MTPKAKRFRTISIRIGLRRLMLGACGQLLAWNVLAGEAVVLDRVAADFAPTIASLPAFPPEARIAGVSGKLDLELAVSRQGDVLAVSTRHATPTGYFERLAAGRIMDRWRFEPPANDDSCAWPAAKTGFVFDYLSEGYPVRSPGTSSHFRMPTKTLQRLPMLQVERDDKGMPVSFEGGLAALLREGAARKLPRGMALFSVTADSGHVIQVEVLRSLPMNIGDVIVLSLDGHETSLADGNYCLLAEVY